MLDKNIIYVTGLPRAGSTLMCQLLGHHPEIYSTGHSSPLCQTLMSLRRNLSDNHFLLAQLDHDFDLVHQRLNHAFRGFMNGWFHESSKTWAVDKNRGWLQHLELLHLLDPNCKVIVCVRELGDILGSIEQQHQKTILLDFPDHIAELSKSDRAKRLFAEDGVVGSALNALEGVQDYSEVLQEHLYYVVFEHLLSEPIAVMKNVYEWLDLSPYEINPQNLVPHHHESDSYYRYKYPHQTYAQINALSQHDIPSRFQGTLKESFQWFYETFYPGLL